MAMDKYTDWTSLAIRRKTGRLINQLAAVITKRERRLARCSKSEAVHIAVCEILDRLKSGRQR